MVVGLRQGDEHGQECAQTLFSVRFPAADLQAVGLCSRSSLGSRLSEALRWPENHLVHAGCAVASAQLPG